ncbi:DctP family TRAP transporter solute-binding subunit [Mesorhizobium sp. ZMM04-5]|uniref:DctP family TRAP transporter solute-binding subunit n=1 Tax=Mesorhizobium marinum TaxID=3228790 RepID=A0ABV3QX84_9HYPH
MRFSWKAACAVGALLSYVAVGSAAAQTIKFSYPVANSNPMGQTIDRFGEIVAEKTGGALRVQGFPDAQLGNEIQTVSSAQGGIVEMGVTSTAGFAGTVAEFDLFNMPFIFANDRVLERMMRGKAVGQMLEKAGAVNLVGLCLWDYGFRNFTNNRGPINGIDDLSGLRMRTIQNRVYLDSLAALGVNPNPLPFPETYGALETGAIDSNEIANSVTRSTSFYEVQKYLTESRHFATAAVVYVGKRFWDQLSADQQGALRASCDEAAAFNREIITTSGAETLAYLAEKGMQVNEIPAENMAAIKAAVAPVIEQVKGRVDADLVTLFSSELAAAEAQTN